MGNRIGGDDTAAAVVGNGVVKELCRFGVHFLAVFIRDFMAGLQERFARFSIQVCAADFDLFAQIRYGDPMGELVRRLIIVFRNAPMTILMIGDVRIYVGRHPDCNLQLQVDLDVRDGHGSVRCIQLPRLSADIGAR